MKKIKKINNEIKGDGFILRPPTAKDAKTLAKHANNKNIAKNMFDGFPSPCTEKDMKSFIVSVGKAGKKQGYTSDLAIVVNGEPVGMIGFSIEKGFKGGIGYWVGEDYWGMGIVSKVVNLITDYLFKKHKLARVTAHVYPWNEGSKKVLEKNGFINEGLLKNYAKKDGKIIDNYQYAKILK